VTLSIYDVLGREIRTLVQAPQLPGVHSAYWDRRDTEGHRIPAGVYLCRLTAGNLERTRALVAWP
jgi:flagellar hook assembly protein FlgD